MRFLDGGPDVPRELIVGQERGETVFVCGAGVSRTAGLPLFGELVEAVYQQLGEDWRDHPAEKEAMDTRQYDRVLRCLERRLAASDLPRNRSMRERIRSAVSTALAPPDDTDLVNHAALLALSRDAEGRERLLTTNFDTLFERAWRDAHGTRIASHAGVALPQPRTANATGVFHLHGRQGDAQLDLAQTEVVLTSAEFGDAYLRSGWASRYVYDLARADTFVLVGYQADDPPMRYLLEALEADRERFPDLKKVYAFGACEIGDERRVNAQWQAKGVEPVLYLAEGQDHSALYATLREWRCYADDPTAWRRERLRALFEAHAGAPTDSQVEACLPWLDRGDALQLLADLSPPSAWLPILLKRGVFEVDALPSEWIAGRFDDPDMIRECAALTQLDRNTGWLIERALERRPQVLSPVRERAWRLLLSVKRARGARHALEDTWYDGMPAIKAGSIDFQSRDLVARILRPQLTIEKPFRWPSDEAADQEESLHRLLRLDFETANELPPSEILAAWTDTVDANAALFRTLDRALVDALERASDLGLLEAWDVASRDVPSVAEHAQNRHRRGFYPIARMLADLWTRIANSDAEQARLLVATWQASPYLLQQRLALFALASDLFSPDEVAAALQATDDDTLWASGAQVEIMRLVTRRWAEFSDVARHAIEVRFQAGIPRALFDADVVADDEKWQSISDASIYRRLIRLDSTGGALMRESHDLLTEIQARHPAWTPGADDRDDFPSWHEMRHGPDGHPELLAGIPDDQLVQEAARLQVERQFEEGDLWRVFSAADPERALRGLIVEGDAGRWSAEAWRYLLWAAADHEAVVLQQSIAVQILRMPNEALTLLVDPAASWLERRRVQLSQPAMEGSHFLLVWDRLSAIVYAARDPEEGQGGFGGDLVSESLNRPGGHLASALLSAMDAVKPSAGEGLPPEFAPRFQQIVRADQRPGMLGRVQLVRDLAYLDAIAPAWTGHELVPRLDWAHPEAQSMWEAFAGGRIGSPRLFMALKPHLLAVFRDKGLSDEVLEALFDKLLWIAFSHGRQEAQEYELTFGEIKRALTVAPNAVRQHVAWQLWRTMAADEQDGIDRATRWRASVGPIFNNIWPLDAHARNADVSQKLTLMALECGAAFPEAVEAILDVLVPYRLYQLEHGLRLDARHDALVPQHPLTFVRLVNALIDPALYPVPADLPKLLKSCLEADAAVAHDAAYARLFGLRRGLGA